MTLLHLTRGLPALFLLTAALLVVPACGFGAEVPTQKDTSVELSAPGESVEAWRSAVHHKIFQRQIGWLIPQGIVDGTARLINIAGASYGGSWAGIPAIFFQTMVGLSNIFSQTALATCHKRVTKTASAKELVRDIRSDGWAFFGLMWGSFGLGWTMVGLSFAGAWGLSYAAIPVFVMFFPFMAVALSNAAVADDIERALKDYPEGATYVKRTPRVRIISASPLGIIGVW